MRTTTFAVSALACASLVVADFTIQQQNDLAVQIIQQTGNAIRYDSIGSTCARVTVDEDQNFDCTDQDYVDNCEDGPCAYSGVSNATSTFYTICNGFEGGSVEYITASDVFEGQACDCQQTCSNVAAVLNTISSSYDNDGGSRSIPLGAIIGAACGGVSVICAIIGLILICIRRRKQQAAIAAARYNQQSQQFAQGYYSPGSVKTGFV